MTELRLLGPKVRDVLIVRRGPQRNPLDDLETESVEATVLGRVVGHEAHGRDAEIDEDLRADAVLALVDREAELDVGLDGVTALVLQVVRPHLVTEPDATTFVAAQVHHPTLPVAGDLSERDAKLP